MLGGGQRGRETEGEGRRGESGDGETAKLVTERTSHELSPFLRYKAHHAMGA